MPRRTKGAQGSPGSTMVIRPSGPRTATPSLAGTGVGWVAAAVGAGSAWGSAWGCAWDAPCTTRQSMALSRRRRQRPFGSSAGTRKRTKRPRCGRSTVSNCGWRPARSCGARAWRRCHAVSASARPRKAASCTRPGDPAAWAAVPDGVPAAGAAGAVTCSRPRFGSAAAGCRRAVSCDTTLPASAATGAKASRGVDAWDCGGCAAVG